MKMFKPSSMLITRRCAGRYKQFVKNGDGCIKESEFVYEFEGRNINISSILYLKEPSKNFINTFFFTKVYRD
jgi:hypothetical protein